MLMAVARSAAQLKAEVPDPTSRPQGTGLLPGAERPP